MRVRSASRTSRHRAATAFAASELHGTQPLLPPGANSGAMRPGLLGEAPEAASGQRRRRRWAPAPTASEALSHMALPPVHCPTCRQSCHTGALSRLFGVTGDCVICIEALEDPVRLPCGHVLCLECALKLGFDAPGATASGPAAANGANASGGVAAERATFHAAGRSHSRARSSSPAAPVPSGAFSTV